MVSIHNTCKFIDLFAGLGGTRIGFEQACAELNLKAQCVFTSEIKEYAADIYRHNFNDEQVFGDVAKIKASGIPDFDFLLGGFPCQSFSAAGNRAGFDDARGTLFFEVARILKEKRPKGFLLENVEGLVTHDRKNPKDAIGNTLKTILDILKGLGYKVSWSVLNAKDFGVPQVRKRIYITGSLKNVPLLHDLPAGNTCAGNTCVCNEKKVFSNIQERGLPPLESAFTKRLLEIYSVEQLKGKTIKDKRGGENNIHSWDLELKGKLSNSQKDLMSVILRERRKKKWAKLKGIAWMDGMPLTLDEIYSFYIKFKKNDLKEMLDDLVEKKYLRFEHPKDLCIDAAGKSKRQYAPHASKGYNIVTGKLSFELNKILGGDCIAPTIIATEADRIGVIDNAKIRKVSQRECLRFFGFPEWYESNIKHKHLYDLIGNTVVVPVIKQVSLRLLNSTF